MDWIKIKTQHVLFSDLSDKQLLALIRIQCLTAHLETEPSEEQILKLVHYKTFKSLKKNLKKGPRDLQEILNRVLRDVQRVLKERERWKANKQRSRSLEKNVYKDISVESLVREDKRR
jgi:hypothetical protein